MSLAHIRTIHGPVGSYPGFGIRFSWFPSSPRAKVAAYSPADPNRSDTLYGESLTRTLNLLANDEHHLRLDQHVSTNGIGRYLILPWRVPPYASTSAYRNAIDYL